jgi:hypothetical protein
MVYVVLVIFAFIVCVFAFIKMKKSKWFSNFCDGITGDSDELRKVPNTDSLISEVKETTQELKNKKEKNKAAVKNVEKDSSKIDKFLNN